MIHGDRRITSADRDMECTATAAKDGIRSAGSLIKATVTLKMIRKAPCLANTLEDYPSVT